MKNINSLPVHKLDYKYYIYIWNRLSVMKMKRWNEMVVTLRLIAYTHPPVHSYLLTWIPIGVIVWK